MARVDYNSLDFDTKIGRKARVCGRCNKLMAVTVECPVRQNQKLQNVYVCWHCCWKCGYSVDTPQGKACSVKINRKKKAEQQRQSKKKANEKAIRQHDEDADYSFFNSIED